MDSAAATALGDLLRSRREQLAPEDVGVVVTGRRRTPGLRREEVAQLADVSATYYTFLEQGRPMRPSGQVLDALARALRLTPVEHAYARTLVTRTQGRGSVETLAPDVVDLVARLDPDPTYVKGRWWDVLAANRAARILFTDWEARPEHDRNLLRWMLTDAEAREVYVDWELEARAMLARFRAGTAGQHDDPECVALVDGLLESSELMQQWWPRLELAPVGSGSKRLRHPELGELTLRHVVLVVPEVPEQKLVTFTCDGDARATLDRLAEALPR